MNRIIRLLAAASLMALLAACGGQGAKDREDAPADREQPGLDASEGDADDDNDEEESRRDGDDDSDD